MKCMWCRGEHERGLSWGGCDCDCHTPIRDARGRFARVRPATAEQAQSDAALTVAAEQSTRQL